jgi:glucokinase
MKANIGSGVVRQTAGAIRHDVMLEVNEHLVLDHVRQHGATTRPEIGQALGLSAASVSRIVRRLVDKGLVSEEPGASTGGRPRSSVQFNRLAGCVIGIDLGGTRCHGLLADLGGVELAEDERPLAEGGTAFGTILETIASLRATADERGLPLSAIAVGVAAIIDPETGVAIGGPNVHWDGFPVRERLAGHIDVPFLVENDVNLAAMGHAWRGDGRGRSSFVVLSIGTGIGAALVSSGRLVTGRHGAAGEIGFLVLEREQLRAGRDGGMGALERLAAGPAVARAAVERLASGGDGSRLRSVGSVSSEAVFAAAQDGDTVAGEVLGELIDHVARALIALGAIVDPDVIILEGSIGRALAGQLPELTRLVEAHLPVPPGIVVSSLGPEATAIGALAAALQLAWGESGVGASRHHAPLTDVAQVADVA